VSASALPLEPPLSPGGSSPFPVTPPPLPPTTEDAPASPPASFPEPQTVPEPPPLDVPAPPAAVQPEPVAQPQAPTPPVPATAPRTGHAVLVRLTNGEQIEVALHADPAAAAAEATALMRYLRDGRGDWPFIAGRFVRPDAIVSIDLSS
jgi:hypothetical protein